MKRLTLLTILLVVVGLTAGFALEVKPSFTLSGSGTLQWGIDLDTGATGFLNSAASDLVVSLIAADSSDTHKGTGDWYGEITISNLELYWTDGSPTPGFSLAIDDHVFTDDQVTVGDVTLAHVLTWTLGAEATVAAKIVGLGGDLAIGAYAAPDLLLDFVAAIEADSDAADDVVDSETSLSTDYATYGTYVSYNVSEALMVGLEVVSEGDWTTNTAQAYAAALDVQAKFAPLTINAGANFGLNYASNPIGLGLKVAADTAMVDGWVGFDGQIVASTFDWEAGAGVTFTIIEVVTADFGVVYNDNAFNNLDVKFVLTEPAAKGLVDNLDATLTVYLLDIASATDDIEYEIIFAAGYLMGKLYPHFGVTFGDASNPVDLDPSLSMYAHVDYTLFDAAKTVLSLAWDSGDLLATPSVMGTIIAGVTITY
jgi:hypothetical protein